MCYDTVIKTSITFVDLGFITHQQLSIFMDVMWLSGGGSLNDRMFNYFNSKAPVCLVYVDESVVLFHECLWYEDDMVSACL